MRYPHLFSPIALGPLEVRNRLMMTVHGGLAAERNVRYYEARAAGGVGLMCVPGLSNGVQNFSGGPGRFHPGHVNEFGGVSPDPASGEGIAYFDDQVIAPMRALAEAAHRHGAVIMGQIYHLGSGRSSGELQPTVSASPVRDDDDRTVPHELDADEIATLVTAWGHAARRGREAGLDGIELHAAHGYLINQFLSPHTNRRTDGYGGSPENRLRFLREIIASVDRLAGADFPVGLRITGAEPVPDGLDVPAVVDIVNMLSPRLAYVSVSAGNTAGLLDGVTLAYASPWLVPPGHNVPVAAAIRREVTLPVIVAGRILTPDQAEQLVAEGSCDVVGMARALLADPQWPNKARDGLMSEIRPCISNNDCHGRGHMICAVNPVATREEEMDAPPPATVRHVLVAGGGPAGMEAARVAAERGHQVVLYEREAELGGQLRTMALDPDRSRLQPWLDYQERQLDEAGVDVRRSTEVTAELLAAERPDVVVLATGGRPAIPVIPGVDSDRVLTAEAVLHGAVPGRRVVVVAGLEDHMRPLTMAILLRERGHEVTLASELTAIGLGVEKRSLHQLLHRLLNAGVVLSPMTAVTAVEGDAVHTRHVITRAEAVWAGVDSVVLACGSVAVDELRSQGQYELHLIGDALSPRQIAHAILDGARVGRAL